MDSRTIIKGGVVFCLTFGFFALIKQATQGESSQPPTTQQSSPIPTREPDTRSLGAISTVPSTTSGEAADQQVAGTVPANDSSQPLDTGSSDIKQLLSGWEQAIVANDAKAEASYYAPNLAVYYGRSNVDNAFVESDKEAFLNHGNQVTNLSLEQISFETETPTTVSIRLVKDVTWQGLGGSTHKTIPSRLNVQKFSDGWKITGEQDFR